MFALEHVDDAFDAQQCGGEVIDQFPGLVKEHVDILRIGIGGAQTRIMFFTFIFGPPGGASFDSFPSDDHVRQSRITEDGGGAFAVQVFAQEPFLELR